MKLRLKDLKRIIRESIKDVLSESVYNDSHGRNPGPEELANLLGNSAAQPQLSTDDIKILKALADRVRGKRA